VLVIRILLIVFRVDTATISQTFDYVPYGALKPLIIWPNKDALKKTMPIDFMNHFQNCVVIIPVSKFS